MGEKKPALLLRRLFNNELFELFRRYWPAEKEALQMVAAFFKKKLLLSCIFHTFGNHLQRQLMPHGNNSSGNLL